MGPSLEIGINKQKKIEKKERKIKKWENVTCGMEESGWKFPPLLINLGDENQRERNKRERK